MKLPDSLSYEDGCFISCGVDTAYEGILRGEVSRSDTVLVVGPGSVGVAALDRFARKAAEAYALAASACAGKVIIRLKD